MTDIYRKEEHIHMHLYTLILLTGDDFYLKNLERPKAHRRELMILLTTYLSVSFLSICSLSVFLAFDVERL